MQINGLTYRQVELCDALWACDTLEAVNLLMRKLTPEERATAETLMQIMIQDSREEEIQSMTSYPAAEEIFKKIKKTG